MNRIVAFIDFTELSEKTFRQSLVISQKTGAELVLLHILAKDDNALKAEAEGKLNALCSEAEKQGVSCHSSIGSGSFFSVAPQMLLKIDCELAIIGTHGVKGIKQNLFGSNIWKLVSHLPCSAMVISNATQISENGFSNVLIPIGPHAEFEKKVHMTAKLLSPQGQVHFFAIDKAGIEINKPMMDRVHQGKSILKEIGFNSDFVQYESQQYSVGFAKETLVYAQEHETDLIAIMTRVSEENAHFGQYDKEAMLLNEYGIPVLSVG